MFRPASKQNSEQLHTYLSHHLTTYICWPGSDVQVACILRLPWVCFPVSAKAGWGHHNSRAPRLQAHPWARNCFQGPPLPPAHQGCRALSHPSQEASSWLREEHTYSNPVNGPVGQFCFPTLLDPTKVLPSDNPLFTNEFIQQAQSVLGQVSVVERKDHYICPFSSILYM